MQEILTLMIRLEGLKRTARAGWNKEFPLGHRLKTRKVPGAESVADHSWSTAMFALMIAETLGLDPLKLVGMALIHDCPEIITLDINTAILDPEERVKAEAKKKLLEDAAMREIFFPMGEWGQRCYELWLEYANQSSPEARVLRQLDKLEACIQAVVYRKLGRQVDPNEFLDYAENFMKDPEFVAMMTMLREVHLGITAAI